ncbi:MAG: outer membrane lipoprotein-sorting protein [Oligoflexia bacterium]|nr:outer membrane lipoprotein-sorting protein [Oligoflexia bacterium]
MHGLIAVLVFFMSITLAYSETAREIIDKVFDNNGQKYQKEVQEMTLIGSNGNSETRIFHKYSIKNDDGTSRVLLSFLGPASIKGVALLTWQNKDGNDDQWLYVPALSNELKRITKGGKKNYFLGTDYTIEDLMTEDRNNFNYSKLNDSKIKNTNCYVIEVVPATDELKSESGYSSRKLYINKTSYIISKIEYFDKNNKLIKTLVLNEIKKIKIASTEFWRADEAILENHNTHHKTVILVISRSFSKEDVSEDYFTHRFITLKKHLSIP